MNYKNLPIHLNRPLERCTMMRWNIGENLRQKLKGRIKPLIK